MYLLKTFIFDSILITITYFVFFAFIYYSQLLSLHVFYNNNYQIVNYISDNSKERSFQIIKNLLNIINFILFANNFKDLIVRIERNRDILIDFTQSAIKKQQLLLF